MNINEHIFNLIRHTPDKYFILPCDTKCEYKTKNAFEILDSVMEYQRKKLYLMNGDYKFHLKKFSQHCIGKRLDIYFNNIKENDQALFALKYRNNNQIVLLKNLLSQSQYIHRFKMIFIIAHCEKKVIETIKNCLPNIVTIN